MTGFRYSKSSKCHSSSFIPKCSLEINFEYCLIDLISFLDVSSILTDLIPLIKRKEYQLWIYSISLIDNCVVYVFFALVCSRPSSYYFLCYSMIQCIHDDDSDWFSRHVPIIHIFVVSIIYGNIVAISNLYLNAGVISRNVSMILSMLNYKFVQDFVSKRFTC